MRVFLTQSTPKQKSSTKDSTPECTAFELKTAGTAKGTNQAITYISKNASGPVLRANEDVQQSMNVTVIKSDGANGVHYTIEATSHLKPYWSPN